MEYLKTNSFEHEASIAQLYYDCFTAGISAQHIDLEELNRYVRLNLEKGYAILAVENSSLMGCLLCLPLTFDEHLPESMRWRVNVEKTLYISELMVAQNGRGVGVGKSLILNCIESVHRRFFSEVVIRVWEENKLALKLYSNLGFVAVDEIVQLKKKPDGDKTFQMKKLYLKKTL
jgi:ribosomal protein S18 acetylase RimI-like enzyme